MTKNGKSAYQSCASSYPAPDRTRRNRADSAFLFESVKDRLIHDRGSFPGGLVDSQPRLTLSTGSTRATYAPGNSFLGSSGRRNRASASATVLAFARHDFAPAETGPKISDRRKFPGAIGNRRQSRGKRDPGKPADIRRRSM